MDYYSESNNNESEDNILDHEFRLNGDDEFVVYDNSVHTSSEENEQDEF